MIHKIKLVFITLITFLLCSCATTKITFLEDQKPILKPNEVIVLTRIKIIHKSWNHMEKKLNPDTGVYETAHPELPEFSIVTSNNTGEFILSSGGDMKPGPVYLGQPIIQEDEVIINLKNGDNVIAIPLMKGKKYSLLRYKERPYQDLVNTYLFRNNVSIKIPNKGIAYIGDIILDTSHQPGDPVYLTRTGLPTSGIYQFRGAKIIDNEKETVGVLKNKHPELFKKYSYKKILATSK